MDQKQIVEKIVAAVSNAVAEVVHAGKTPEEVREHYNLAVYTMRAMSLVYFDHFSRRGGSMLDAEHRAQGLLESVGAQHLVPDALIHLPAPRSVQIVEKVVEKRVEVKVPVEKVVEKVVEKIVYRDAPAQAKPAVTAPAAPPSKPAKPAGKK